MDKMDFSLGNPQEEAPKRIETKSKKGRTVALIAVAAVVLIAVLAAVLWDANAFDGLRRRFIYARAEKDENGCAQLYDYGGDRAARFAGLDGSLLIASPSQIRLIGDRGAVLFEESVRLQSCTVVQRGGLAAVCDVGGSEVYLMDSRGLVRHVTAEGQLISATLNDKGYLALTVNDTGYKASVKVYDPAGEPVFDFHSADRFLMSAAVSRDCRYVMAVTLGEADGAFANRLVTYRLNSTEPSSRVDLSGGVIYDVAPVGKHFCAVAEDALYLLSADGELQQTWSFEGDALRRCDMGGDGYAALLLGHYKSGSQCRLVTVNEDGKVLGQLEVDGDVVDLSVSGRYLAVLFSDHMTVYDKTLQELATLNDVSTVRQTIVRDDGSAVLAGLTSASLYLP